MKRITLAGLLLALAVLACAVPGVSTPTVAPPPTVTEAPATLPPETPATPEVTESPATATPAPATTEPQEVTPTYFYTLTFFDAQNGWALDENYLLRSVDGGNTWLNIMPEGMTPYDSGKFFLDADHAWLLNSTPDGTSGVLWRTADGGTTWQSFQVPMATATFHFVDAQTGFAMTDLGVGAGSMAIAIYATMDGGETWELRFVNDPNLSGAREDIPLSGIKTGLYFLNAQTGWVSGVTYASGQAYFYKTTDGGFTWQAENLPLPPAFADSFVLVEPPCFFGQNTGVLVAGLSGDNLAQVALRTFDGGNTWQTGFPLNISAPYACVLPFNLYFWDGGPTMFVSVDGGESWMSQATNLNLPGELQFFTMANQQYGWALLLNDDGEQELYASSDGGAVWNLLWP